MSNLRQRARDLVRVYDHILEQQIVGRGCSLACKDEKLWKEVEEQLKDTSALETHCLGLDPLRVMEESLKASAAAALAVSYGRRVKSRGGLQGLAKAFEVLEQAALNLYLGPWREEYKVIKMYSGTFTHYITPVLSMPQIEDLFGRLGYQPSLSRPEQLCLLLPKVNPGSLDDLLLLSCAFFLARCECHLLLSALGTHVNDAQWELSMVRERQRGNNLQVALENTKKSLEVNQPLVETIDEEVDLYRDERADGEQKKAVSSDEENPPFINGASCMSTPMDAENVKHFSSSKSKSKYSSAESESDQIDSKQIDVSGLGKGEPNTSCSCSCLNALILLKHCAECNTFHDITCASIKVCQREGHEIQLVDSQLEKKDGVYEMPPSSEVYKGNATKSSPSSSVAMSSHTVCDDAKPASLSSHPITYHDCCDLVKPDPWLLCHSCHIFHSRSCEVGKNCRITHDSIILGICSCGSFCSRKPLVLCRYCGQEYCSKCWFRNPLTCTCGQTFDQSSSV